MATPAERKALLFIGVVALLGAGVRLWRAHHPSAPSETQSSSSRLTDDASNDRSSRASTSKRRKKTTRTTDRFSPDPDSNPNPPLVDLDVASIDDIDALGVLAPGQARQIVHDRETYGPFGSIQALERIPYFPKSAITKLAPRVTFSRLPRPSNAVIQKRPDSTPTRRSRRRHLDVSP